MWFPLTPTICVPFLKTRGRPSSEKRLSFCKYRTNHYFWMALILERNQQTGSMEINYWIRTGHAHPPQIFYFQFLSGQSVIINLFHPTSAEDRLVVVERRICTRYLNYFNPFNSYSQLRQLSFRDFGLFFFRLSANCFEYIAGIHSPAREHDRMDVLCKSVSTLSNRIFNRKGRRLLHGFHVSIEFENTYVRIYERIELDREEYILSVAAILQPMNTFKTIILLFEVDSISRELAFSS